MAKRRRKSSSNNTGCAGAIVALVVCGILITVLPWIGLVAAIGCTVYFSMKVHGESKGEGVKRGSIVGVVVSGIAIVICGGTVLGMSTSPDTEPITPTAANPPMQISSSSLPDSMPSSDADPLPPESQAVASEDVPTASEDAPSASEINEPPEEIPSEAPIDTSDSESASVSSVPEPQAIMVWISNKGNKYHSKSSCSNMDSPWQVTLEEAQAMGRGACKRCY